MKAEKFSNALENVDDRYILQAAQARPAGHTTVFTWKRWVAAAACLCLITGSVFAVRHFTAPQTVEPIVQTAPAADAPNGMRPMLNLNGLRYVFLGNGAVYQIPDSQLGDALGTLTYDITADPEANAKKDLSTTFALGGTVYALTGYDTSFRIAVELDGEYYLCQSTGYTDGQLLDPSTYFPAAGFPDNIETVSVFDHAGSNLLAQLPDEDVERFAEALAQSTPAQLSDEQYQQIGQAQRDGKSYQVSFDLKDGTAYTFYVIPSLNIAMFGDGRYTMAQDFADKFSVFFESLVQEPQPMF